MNNLTLPERMKQYEEVSQTNLLRKTPVIVRVDGKKFSSFTRPYGKFHSNITLAMSKAVYDLISNVQGAAFIYSQSDEISILLKDYNKIESEPFLGYNVQKITSIISSMVTCSFNSYEFLSERNALFDARVFNLPKEEVTNYFIWRQRDSIKNSISCLALEFYSEKELRGKNSEERKQMIISAIQENKKKLQNLGDIKSWDDLNPYFTYGFYVDNSGNHGNAAPLFSENRELIDNIVYNK